MRPGLQAIPGVRLAGSDPGAPPPRKAAGAPTPDSSPSGALEAVLAPAAPYCRPLVCPGQVRPPGADPATSAGPCTQTEAWAAAATLHPCLGGCTVGAKRESTGSQGIFTPTEKGEGKAKPRPSTPHPSKNVTPNRSHRAFPESAPGRKIPDAPQLGRLFRNLIPPNRIAKIGLRICNILED